jgi:hypothetical protein
MSKTRVRKGLGDGDTEHTTFCRINLQKDHFLPCADVKKFHDNSIRRNGFQSDLCLCAQHHLLSHAHASSQPFPPACQESGGPLSQRSTPSPPLRQPTITRSQHHNITTSFTAHTEGTFAHTTHHPFTRLAIANTIETEVDTTTQDDIGLRCRKQALVA